MAKSVDERVEEIKEFWIRIRVIPRGVGASDWLQEIRRHLVEHGDAVRREERERCMKLCKCGLADMEKEMKEAEHGGE